MSAPIVFLATLASMAMIWVWLFWLYDDWRVDQFRQEMFGLRDHLFDDARKGALSFDHPAYGMLRTTMNGFIRYAHMINLMQFLIVVLWAPNREMEERFGKRFQDVVDKMDLDQRKLCFSYMEEINKIVLRQIFVGSPVLLITIFVPLALYIIIRNFFGWLLAFLREPLDEFDSIAFAAGE